MPMHPWEMSQYQYAAEQACYRLNENPHEDVGGVPRWTVYATKMHELRVLTDVLRQFMAL